MLNLGPVERGRLIAEAMLAGVSLDARALERFSRFAELLTTWVARTRLISCRDASELVDRHFLDSLALVRLLPERASLVDLGSGAGFPGVPLAIVRPEDPVLLVEARRLRASFLRDVKRALALREIQILEQRAESGPPGDPAKVRCDIAVCRAVWSDESIFPIAARWLKSSGRLLWMRSRPSASRGVPAPAVQGEMVFEGEHTYRIGRRAGIVWAFRRRRDDCFT